jgi:hypothetical protein
MWSTDEQAALARVDENDRIAAAAVARRYLRGTARSMLESDSGWEWAATVGLGTWLYRRRVVAPTAVTGYVGRVMAGLEQEARTASMAPRIPADEWALRMAGISAASALIAGALAAGGWARLDVVRPEVEEQLASEIRYLDRFADDVAAGRVLRDGRFFRRAMLYGAAGWGFYMALRGRTARRRDYGEERNILDAGAEHCGECVGETDRGWRPIGELIPIGSRQCRSGCRCRFEYRNAAGEVVE